MKAVLIILFVLSASSVFGGNRCRTYEYQEIKDMDEKELDAEIKETLSKGLSEMQYSNKLLELGVKITNKEYKDAESASNHCDEQMEKLMKMRSKKYPNKPKNEIESVK